MGAALAREEGRLMAKLVLLLEDGATRDIPLDQERITLGRRADNDVCLPHPAVSGEHAAVVTLLADSFLEDLGSTNGTYVNGQLVQKHFLRDGDMIELGRQRLVYLADDSARPTVVHGSEGLRTSAGGVAASAAPEVKQWDRPMQSSATSLATPTQTTAPLANPSRSDSGEWVSSGAANEWTHAVHRGAHIETDQTPELIVLTGPSAGRALALTKDVTSVGRSGVQVALIRRTPRGYVVTASEGSRPPLHNGAPIEPGGALLAPGDVIEVAGARIEFSAPPDLPT